MMERKVHINPDTFGYHLYDTILEPNELGKGISHGLDYIKRQLELNDILLYRKDEIGNYRILEHSGTSGDKRKVYNNVLNIEKNKIPDNGVEISINGKKVKGVTIIPFLDKKYMMMIAHHKAIRKRDYPGINTVIKQSMEKILKKREKMIESNKKIKVDEVTNLGNRTAYETKKQQYNSKLRSHVTLALFDLFRLKSINDDISHLAGDVYIKEAGEILQKYFPMYREIEAPDGNHLRVKTGDKLYRIGGDEYVLLSNSKSKEDIEKILPYIVEEVESIELDTEKSYHTSMNYGVSERYSRETIDQLFQEAEAELLDDKTNMYRKLGINRRR